VARCDRAETRPIDRQGADDRPSAAVCDQLKI